MSEEPEPTDGINQMSALLWLENARLTRVAAVPPTLTPATGFDSPAPDQWASVTTIDRPAVRVNPSGTVEEVAAPLTCSRLLVLVGVAKVYPSQS